MENQSVIASTEPKEKHAINACHSFMIDPGKEEPKKILTNVSVSIPEVHRKSGENSPEVDFYSIFRMQLQFTCQKMQIRSENF